MDRDTALAFFFAVFWSVAISGMQLLRVFHVWDYAAYELKSGWWAAVRLVYGVGVVNVLPFGLFVAAQKVVPDRTSTTALCACVASVSVFSICFFLPCFLQFGLAKVLYPDAPQRKSWAGAAKKAEMGTTWKDGAVSLGTALMYCIVPLALAYLFAQCLGHKAVPPIDLFPRPID